MDIGQVLNKRYRIERLLGQGGFGAVYQAWDMNLDERVAIKECLVNSSAAQKQFQTEARLLFRLRHTNLPVVHDLFIVPDQGLYLAMDYIEGENLDSMVRRQGNPLDFSQARPWIMQVFDALIYLHSQNPPIIHRDIKPANIIIASGSNAPDSGSGTVRRAFVVDFGLSKVLSSSQRTTTAARAIAPVYSPPEQFGLGSTDERSDVYALGATLYHILTARALPPVMDVMAGLAAPAPPVAHVNPSVPLHVSAAIERALRINRQERWPDMADFRQAIESPAPASVDTTQIIASPPILDRTVQARTPTAIPKPTIVLEPDQQAGESPGNVFVKTDKQHQIKNYLRRAWLMDGVGFLLIVMLGLFYLYGMRSSRSSILPVDTPSPSILSSATVVSPGGEYTPVPSPSPSFATPTLTPTLSSPPSYPADLGTPLPEVSQVLAPENAAQAIELARWGKGTLNDIAVSPDGKYLAAATALGIYLYDALTLEQTVYLSTWVPVNALVYMPDGTTVVAGMGDETLYLIDIRSGNLIGSFSTNGSYVRSLALSGDGRLLSTVLDGTYVALWSLPDGKLIRKFESQTDLNGMALSQDGKTLAFNNRADVLVYNATDGDLLYTIAGHSKDAVRGLAISPDGQTLAVSGTDQAIRLYQLVDGSLVGVLEGHTKTVSDLAFSPDGSVLISTGWDSRIGVWNWKSGELVRFIEAQPSTAYHPVFSPDGKAFFTENYNDDIQRYQTSDGALQASQTQHEGAAVDVRFDSTGETMLISRGISVEAWMMPEGRLIFTSNITDTYIYQVYAIGEDFYGLSGYYSPRLSLWRFPGPDLIASMEAPTDTYGLALSPLGDQVAAGARDRIVYQWNAADGSLLRSLSGHSGKYNRINDLVYSPDGSVMVTCDDEGSLFVWRASDGERLGVMQREGKYFHDLLFMPDGNSVITEDDGVLYFWDVHSASLASGVKLAGKESVDMLALSPDGSLLATSVDHTVQLWSTKDGALLNTLGGFLTSVYAAAFSPDGRYLVTASFDGTLRFWGVP